MKFDGNQAWKQAAAWVSANRDVVIALAGVFFLLPSLAVSLFAPQPVPAAGMTREQIMMLSRAYYLQALPYILPMLVLQALGMLAILTLFTDTRRPTVSVAIRQSLSGIFAYVFAQLLPGIAIGIVAGIVIVVAGLLAGAAGTSLVMPMIAVAIAVIVAAAVYTFVRCSLCGPIIAVEKVRNPIAALTRSWKLTHGNAGRLVLFFVIVAVLFIVIIAVVNALIGIVLALLLSAANAQVVLAVISAAFSAAATVFFVAILAAAHRQLAGPALADHRDTFG